MRITPFFLALAIVASAADGSAALPAAQPPSVSPPLKDLPGVVPWSALSKVTSVKVKGGRLLPKYPDTVQALDNTRVKLQGFMMPLEPGEKQKHFLLTVTSPSCSYCLPAGPEGVVEVKTTVAIKFSYSPIVIGGTLNVLKDDPMGLYYRLTSAVLTAAQ